jgi:glycosyltransferase involved in cell wall biosynthesis
MSPFFSIITPVYNREKPVQTCIESVLSQTNTEYEMILINDGSRDDTVKNIEFFMNKDGGRLRLIDYPFNQGVNYARNRGMEKAKGQFLLFLDSDDHLTSPRSLEIVRDQIAANPGYLHYLFRVVDREKDANLPTAIFEYQYQDWITGKASGDFVHVISPSCFMGMPFLEEFRIYEALNWLRVLRKNEKQIYIPITITTRDRKREDSVTKETQLHNKAAQKNKFDFLEKYLHWYAGDLCKYGMKKKLTDNVRTAILLGIALGEKERNRTIIDTYVQNRFNVFFFKTLNSGFLKEVTFRAIRMKSLHNISKAQKVNHEK